MANKERIQKLRQRLAENRIDAILVSQPENLYYLSGCEGLEGYILLTEINNIIVTDFRYFEQAQRESPDYAIFLTKGKMNEWLPDLFHGRNIRRLALESSHLSLAVYSKISDILKAHHSNLTIVPEENLIESLRMIKEPEEIQSIIEAGKITAAALAYTEKILIQGVTEKTLAWQIEKFMRQKGSQTIPFEVIVAAGPNAALPHAKPSDYAIRTGEPVIVDIGSKYKYYVSDMTRTFYIGQPDDKFQNIYDTVLKAQLEAISGIKTGMTGQEADSIAREVINKAGYGEAFGHSLGHSLGLYIHEGPNLGPTSADILQEGMVFTVEPGIYLSGWGGVRIEDDAIIENGKARVITSAKK